MAIYDLWGQIQVPDRDLRGQIQVPDRDLALESDPVDHRTSIDPLNSGTRKHNIRYITDVTHPFLGHKS